MRAVTLMLLLTAPSWPDDALGSWKMNPIRSPVAGDPSTKSVGVRIEPHAKGEVFTLDPVEADGRSTTVSTILYLDGTPRDFQDSRCSGTQSLRHVDSQTVEILRKCTSGEWVQFIRRLSAWPNELVLEVTEQQVCGLRVELRA